MTNFFSTSGSVLGTASTMVSSNISLGDSDGGLVTPSISYVISSQNYEAGIKSGSKDGKEIPPQLYFKFVKSRLRGMQPKRLEADVAALRAGIESAGLLKQRALYEALQQELAITLHQMLCRVHGYERFLMPEDVTKFMARVTEKPIAFKPLADFPRPIPEMQKKMITEAMEKKLFDEVMILYIERKGGELKTTEKKIKEKDPIAFGRLNIPGSPLYYICDWIDEFCDLTLDKFVTRMNLVEPGYHVKELKPVSEKDVTELVARVRQRHERLQNTNRQNWQVMAGLEHLENGKLTGSMLKNVLRALWRAAKNRFGKGKKVI